MTKELQQAAIWLREYMVGTVHYQVFEKHCQENINNMARQAINNPEPNQHFRGKVAGMRQQLNYMNEFITAYGTDDDTEETSSKT